MTESAEIFMKAEFTIFLLGLFILVTTVLYDSSLSYEKTNFNLKMAGHFMRFGFICFLIHGFFMFWGVGIK